MKISKGQAISFFAALLLFAVMSIVIFLTPLAHTVNFWLGYFFAIFAFLVVGGSLVMYFGKEVKEDKFLALPAVKLAWTYFIIQLALSVWQMISFPLPYTAAIIINALLGLLFVVLILATSAAANKIDSSDSFVAEKVLFIKQLKLRVDSLDSKDEEVTKALKAFSENVRYSDPLSHSMLESIEETLLATVDELSDNITDKDRALTLCAEAEKLLKTRNEQCKMYKGVKDPAAAAAKKGKGGLPIAFTGVGATLTILLITLTVCFIIVPQGKYDAAMDLLEAKKYTEAIAAFEELGTFSDSEEKVEEIKTIILDESYAAAEQYFVDGNYTDALEIYKSLDGYKDSAARIEEIYNRLSSGKKIYFGSFDGEPIAWQIVKSDEDKLLLLADKPVKQLPVNSELKSITFEESTLYAWLESDFMKDFTTEQKSSIISVGGQKAFLLDEKTVLELEKAKVNLATETDWWIADTSEQGFKFVNKSGALQKDGELCIRDKGVRPALWLSLD